MVLKVSFHDIESLFGPRSGQGHSFGQVVVMSAHYQYNILFIKTNIYQNQFNKNIVNIAFTKGGAHLPIVHTLRLLERDMISWGGYFLGSGDFFGGG